MIMWYCSKNGRHISRKSKFRMVGITISSWSLKGAGMLATEALVEAAVDAETDMATTQSVTVVTLSTTIPRRRLIQMLHWICDRNSLLPSAQSEYGMCQIWNSSVRDTPCFQRMATSISIGWSLLVSLRSSDYTRDFCPRRLPSDLQNTIGKSEYCRFGQSVTCLKSKSQMAQI